MAQPRSVGLNGATFDPDPELGPPRGTHRARRIAPRDRASPAGSTTRPHRRRADARGTRARPGRGRPPCTPGRRCQSAADGVAHRHRGRASGSWRSSRVRSGEASAARRSRRSAFGPTTRRSAPRSGPPARARRRAAAVLRAVPGAGLRPGHRPGEALHPLGRTRRRCPPNAPGFGVACDLRRHPRRRRHSIPGCRCSSGPAADRSRVARSGVLGDEQRDGEVAQEARRGRPSAAHRLPTQGITPAPPGRARRVSRPVGGSPRPTNSRGAIVTAPSTADERDDIASRWPPAPRAAGTRLRARRPPATPVARRAPDASARLRRPLVHPRAGPPPGVASAIDGQERPPRPVVDRPAGCRGRRASGPTAPCPGRGRARPAR